MLIAFARQSLAGLRVLLALTVVTGILYPAVLLLVGQGLFNDKANGSFVESGGETVGSSLVAQGFTDDEWFWPRPSAAGDGYDGLASAASNLGPENEDLVALIEERRAAVAEAEGVDPDEVTVDALTASGSGLDPHISPEYARQQIARVAEARDLDEAEVRALLEENVQGRELGFLGQERVNVLELNIALDALG